MQERYRQIEDAFFRLRGQYDTGRIDQAEFERELRELMIEDAQRRTWMIGADSGRWYYWDGTEWLPGNPFSSAKHSLPERPTPRSASSAPKPVPPKANETRAEDTDGPGWAQTVRQIVLAGLASGVVLGLVAGLALALTGGSNRNLTQVSAGLAAPTEVGIATPSATPLLIIIPPSPTPPATSIQATNTPAPTVTPVPPTPTAIPPTNTSVPPTKPGAKPTEFSSLDVIPTITPFGAPPAAQFGPPGATPLPAQQPQIQNAPPGVYVTNLVVSPNPRRRRPVTFTASFLNTTGRPQNFAWRVVVTDPNKPGGNKDFGQSNPSPIVVPPGQSQFWIRYTVVTNPGGCIPLQALPAWQSRDNARMFFPNTDGIPVVANFQVC